MNKVYHKAFNLRLRPLFRFQHVVFGIRKCACTDHDLGSPPFHGHEGVWRAWMTSKANRNKP
jgi:hypothetical protein